MRAHRLAVVFGTLLLAASALAQFSGEQKTEVLDQMDKVLAKDAFVPGVDLKKWRTFINSRKDQLTNAETPWEFANVVNGALSEFGLSHIQLLRDRMRRRFGGGETLSALQGWNRRSPAELSWIEDDAALIRISTFDTGYDEETVSGLFDQAKDAKYLVLDLRGNPGGEVEHMRHFLGLVVPQDAPVGTFVSRNMANDFARSAKGDAGDPVAIAAWANRKFRPRQAGVDAFKGQIAVLIDGRSASASEIVAEALREIKHSPLVGSKTAGAVLMSTFGQLSYGFKIQYPVGDYVTCNGLRLEGHPLGPDVSSAGGSDAVDAALTRLKAKALTLLRFVITV